MIPLLAPIRLRIRFEGTPRAYKVQVMWIKSKGQNVMHSMQSKTLLYFGIWGQKDVGEGHQKGKKREDDV